MKHRFRSALFLTLVIVLSGCTGLTADSPSLSPTITDTSTQTTTTPEPVPAPDAPPRNVIFTITAGSDVTVSGFTILPENDGVRIFYRDGSKTFPGVLSSAELPAGALEGATGIEPIRSGESVEFSVSTGTEGGTFEWPTRPTAMLVSVADAEDRVLRWVVADCVASELTSVTIVVHETGEGSHAYGCGAVVVE